jgi:hypothetical protein
LDEHGLILYTIVSRPLIALFLIHHPTETLRIDILGTLPLSCPTLSNGSLFNKDRVLAVLSGRPISSSGGKVPLPDTKDTTAATPALAVLLLMRRGRMMTITLW